MAQGVLRISEAASLAIHAMMVLVSDEDKRPLPVTTIAEMLGVSSAHLGKVFQRLVREGLVLSKRGPHGGFTLSRAPEEMTLLQVYEAIDGPLDAHQCLLGRDKCPVETCVLGTLLYDVHERMRDYLENTNLSKLDRPMDELKITTGEAKR